MVLTIYVFHNPLLMISLFLLAIILLIRLIRWILDILP
jgi:hypothetical protein